MTNGATPGPGTGVDSIWYGNAGVGSFIANDAYAEADGAGTDFLQATFNATVPEAGTVSLLVMMLAGVGISLRKRFLA